MKYKWKLWLVPLVAILVLGIIKGGSFWGKNNTPPAVPVEQTVAVKDVEKINKEHILPFTGDVEAVEQAVIGSKVPGRVARVAVENGDGVKSGQALVLLENQEYRNALTINQALLKKAEANLVSVRTSYERFKELYEGGAVSKKDYEDVETGLLMAEAEANSAAAAVANAGEALNNTYISSPLNGVVVNRSVNLGQVVSPGVPLMSVADISSVYVLVNVEQQDLAVIKPGMKVKVTVDTYSDREFEGVVEIINPAANKAARVFQTKIKVSNPELLLKPGMFAKAEIKTGEAEEVLAVPLDALSGNQGMNFVFLAEGDRAKRQQVEIGQIIGQRVEIKSGLSLGQKVIITNVNKLKDQDSIKIAELTEE